MLIKDFYKIIESEAVEKGIRTRIKLNVDHEVYKGHFKNQPVVPGVIQLQIVKEIIESSLQFKLIMNNLIQVKYLVPIIPDESMIIAIELLQVSQIEDVYKYNVILSSGDIIFTKAKIELEKENDLI